MIPTMETLGYADIAERLTQLSDTPISAADLRKLEKPIGTVDNPAEISGGVLVGYSGAFSEKGYDATVTLKLDSLKRVTFQRNISTPSIPCDEIVRDALCGLIYMLENPESGQRMTANDRFDRHFGE